MLILERFHLLLPWFYGILHPVQTVPFDAPSDGGCRVTSAVPIGLASFQPIIQDNQTRSIERSAARPARVIFVNHHHHLLPPLLARSATYLTN